MALMFLGRTLNPHNLMYEFSDKSGIPIPVEVETIILEQLHEQAPLAALINEISNLSPNSTTSRLSRTRARIN